jgi:cyclopropane fatty-acyl-phospholipid synthase-like methyltransferase
MREELFDPQKYWESYFEDIDRDSKEIERLKQSELLQSFCSEYLKVGSRILDLGCGGGRNAIYLATGGYEIHGVDISNAAVELCKKRLARHGLPGDFKQGTFSNIPYPNNFFDGVICIASLDHVSFQMAQESIIEIRRILRIEGIVLLTFDPPETDEDRIHEAEVLSDGTCKFVRGKQKGMLFRRYEDKEIKRLLVDQEVISFKHTEKGARIVIYK